MRLLLFVMIFFWLRPVSAQTHQLGLNYGPLYYSGITSDTARLPSLAGYGHNAAFSFRTTWKLIEVGCGLELGNTKARDVIGYLKDDNGIINAEKMKVNVANVYFLQYLLVNLRLPLRKVTLHAGILGGFLYIRSRGLKYPPTGWGPNDLNFSMRGFMAGLQAGAAYNFSSRFALSGEIAARRSATREIPSWFWGSPSNVRYEMNTVHVLVGARYIFN